MKRPLAAGLFVAAALSTLACRESSAGDVGPSGTSSRPGSTSLVVGTLGSTTVGDATGADATVDTSAGDVTSANTDMTPTRGSGTTMSGDTSKTSDTGVNTGKPCSLAAIDVVVDPSAVVDAGDQPGQIPTVVGEALLRNCGCHYTDDVEGYTDYISNAAPMSTHADFHSNFDGVFPMGFEDRLIWEACEVRVVFGLPVPMPPNECGVEGEPGNMSHADLVVFAQWFEAGAPDGASFP